MIQAHEYFSALVGSDDGLPLFEAAASLELDIDPTSDIAAPQHELDRLVSAFATRLPADCSQIQKLRLLNHYFYRELGFAGNVNNYYDPDNSYLQRVLESRRGIPISLAVIYMEMANQLGLDVKGISFPGHFLMKLSVPSGDVIIDPFNGSSLTREDLEERLQPFLHMHNELEPQALSSYLKAASSREILTRMLHNLKALYDELGQWQRLLDVSDRLVILLPHNVTERRDRGLCHAQMDQHSEAIADIEVYLDACPHAEDADSLHGLLIQLRDAHRRLN